VTGPKRRVTRHFSDFFPSEGGENYLPLCCDAKKYSFYVRGDGCKGRKNNFHRNECNPHPRCTCYVKRGVDRWLHNFSVFRPEDVFSCDDDIADWAAL
jgi:hypothetical protein